MGYGEVESLLRGLERKVFAAAKVNSYPGDKTDYKPKAPHLEWSWMCRVVCSLRLSNCIVTKPEGVY